MSKRVNCYTAGCSNCTEGLCIVKRIFLGKKRILYSCKAYKHKHEKVDGRKCEKFRCSTPGTWKQCQNCRRGK